MHHEMMAGPSGTFIGHLIPGLVLIALVLWWIADIFFRGTRKPGDALERTLHIPVVKLLAVFVAVYFEIPDSTWYPMDWLMGWHHITVYIAFALSAVVDFLAHKKILSARATLLAFSGASMIGALLFYGHGTGPGVEGTCHAIIMFLFFSISFFTLLEAINPEWKFDWYRIATTIGLGVWMCISAWIIFKSGWDLHDHVKEAHVWLLFSWMVLAVATLTTCTFILASRKEMAK